MTTRTRVEEAVRSALADAGPELATLELFDLEVGAGLVRVLVDRPGGVDLDTLSLANRSISAALDQDDPLPGRYTLEVSSPGLERPLRTPAHFARFQGETVKVKTRADSPGGRHCQGALVAADEEGIAVAVEGAERRIAYQDIEDARTVFTWGSSSDGAGGRAAKSPRRPERSRRADRSRRGPASADPVHGKTTSA